MGDQLRENVDYECLRSFSSGAFGKVYAGYLSMTGEAVVIKKGKKKDLKSEYDILKQLGAMPGAGKTHIVRVFGYTDYAPDFNIIMERAQCSLDHLLGKVPFRVGLPAVDMIQLVSDLGMVLAFLLDKKVIHRDIKPQNILVFSGASDPAKSQFMFKLCDFGAARATSGEDDPCHTIMGTPAFLNPEILLEYQQHPNHHRMNVPYTPEKADLWSLGVTIYNAATGSLPWPAVRGVEETRALHGKRPSGSICALPLAQGVSYRYYNTIRAKSYPRWLTHALSSLVRTQFTACAYDSFLRQCASIAIVGGAREKMPGEKRGSQKRLVLLPALTPTLHAEVDQELFPGAHIQLNSLFGLPLQTRTACLTADGITVFGPGQPISLGAIADDTVVVWNETSTGFGTDAGRVLPKFGPSRDREVEHLRCVQECYDLDRQCDEIVEAYRVSVQIAKKNVDRVVARTAELRQWLHSIERNEKHAASTAAIAALLQSHSKEMLEQLRSCPAETEMRRKEVERCAAAASQLVECAARWTPLDERHIANWHDSLRRLSSRFHENTRSTAFEMDEKWARTMMRSVEGRLAGLKADCENRVRRDAGVGHVIRILVSLDVTLSECVRKMKETASVVSTVADQARNSVTGYMQATAGLDEAQIRKNLTNSVSAVSLLRRNVERQAELARKIEEMRVSCKELSINGSANGVVKPYSVNVNQTLDLDTITPARSSFE
ncbi:hypothetical protein PENTCL1PPCAC_10490 [Pristionchus entomophagus]|uniref:IkappaB kinase n=1 Tax=Pristionchus entomophagus TaxID=358040 RepID=A0AAV5SZX1_9BILA|nr:hypothetical protein PENTCL1PPCAC_10490 [Pristionchus entomophagus]